MALTNEQLLTLKADIAADPAFANMFDAEIAAAYNLPASPTWTVWKTSVTPDEWTKAILETAGAGLQADGLAQTKILWLTWAFERNINPSIPATRTTLEDWCGTQNTLKAAIATAQKRTATRAEKLFSTGTGSTASPATMTFEGRLTYQDVEAAKNA
jgi:hypothetical protein